MRIYNTEMLSICPNTNLPYEECTCDECDARSSASTVVCEN